MRFLRTVVFKSGVLITADPENDPLNIKAGGKKNKWEEGKGH